MPPKYKPGGRKFPPKIISKPLPPQIPNNISTNEPTTSGLDEESENKFELELCWCIQQLELTMQTTELPEKQSKEANKSLNSLRSCNVPLIKKRQIMRTTFGDYRAKMKNDEIKYGKSSSSVKFLNNKNKDNKSIFVRKAKKNNHDHVDDDDKKSSTKIDNNNQLNKPKLSTLFTKNELQTEPFKFNFTI